jgi:NADPH:quinone reductase-like Zn-dependent oxidoreductase
MKKMRSIVYEQYVVPEVLQQVLTQIPEPGPEQLLIKVHNSTVTAADWHLRKADPFYARMVSGLFRPKQPVLGQEFSGEVIQTGSSVHEFGAGDRVYGSTSMKTGSYSDYILLDQESVIVKSPRGVDPHILAAVPVGAMTALFFLKKGKLDQGARVLINGASGSVGSYAVQIAKAFGAEATGICSTGNVDLVKALGADRVIDYKTTDLTELNEQYDIIFDTVGNLRFSRLRHNLSGNGHFVSTAFHPTLLIQMILSSFRKGTRVYTGVTQESREALQEITDMIRKGNVRPLIDRIYSMEEVREAHRYAETGRKKGNVLLAINNGGIHAGS